MGNKQSENVYTKPSIEIIRYRSSPTAEQFNDMKIRASKNNLVIAVAIGEIGEKKIVPGLRLPAKKGVYVI